MTAPDAAATAGALGAAHAARQLSEGTGTAVDLVHACLAAIDVHDGDLRAFVAVDRDGALEAALASDRRRRAGRPIGPLDGVVIAVKDVLDVAGMPTRAGSRVLADRGPASTDAASIARLRAAGAVLIGKTNTHEFALGGTGENAWTGHARNPHHPSRITGGSSSGSAVAVATGMAHAALGTDAGGSVRGPAALCGVVGVKPTFGRIDLAGALPSGWSLDHLGVIAPAVADVRAVLEALDLEVGPSEAPRTGRLGVPGRYFTDRLQPAVRAAWTEALAALAADGLELVDLPQWPDVPLVEAADAVSWTLNAAEAAAFHEPWLRADPTKYGDDIRERLEIGGALLASEYLRAQRLRRHVVDALEGVWAHVDALVTPACPTTAFPHGTLEIELDGYRMPAATSLNRCFRVANLTGWPAITVPAGIDADGLPIALQLLAPIDADGTLLELAERVERTLRRGRRGGPDGSIGRAGVGQR